MRGSIRVRGVTYRAPDDAYVAAAELEDNAETIAGNLRRNGRDAEAEQVSDRARADAERLRVWAREREETEAAATAQPSDTPPPASSGAGPGSGRRDGAPKGRSTRRSRGGGSGPRRSSSGGRRSGSVFTPRTRTIIVGTRIPAATSSATGLALQLLGLTLGVAFLTLLLTDRGVSAFGSLAGGVSGGLRWLLDPVDPLAPRSDFASGAHPSGGGGDFATRKTATTPARPTVAPLTLAGVG